MNQPQTATNPNALDIKATLDQLRTMYTDDIAQGTFNALWLGEVGTGKTTLLKTCRFPILIHSFDPGGTKVLKTEIEAKKVIVDSRYEKEDANSPTAYALWESEFFKLRNGGLFDKIGTYCLDSFTTWFECLKNQINARKAVKSKAAAGYRGATSRSVGVMEQMDWQVAGNIVRDMSKLCTALPCDFIMTGHLLLEKEDVSGRMIAYFNSIPSLRVNVPLLFDEIYVLICQETSQGVERKLLTQPTGKYVARTRIGAGKFDLYETPNIKALLTKAGLPATDKEAI